MLSENSNLCVEYENIDNDFTNQECNSQNLNSNEFYHIDFKFLNQSDFKTNCNISLNNNLSPPPLLINNYISEKNQEKSVGVMRNVNNDNNDNNNKSDNKKKKYLFITKDISYKKELLNNLLKKTVKCGRKKKDDITKGGHNKYSDDNLRRKCKHLVLKSFIDFINEKIEILYEGNIGNNIFKKKFLTFNKTQKAESSITYNKNFLIKTLKEICSDTISSRFTTYRIDHNKNLIEMLLNEEDKEKREYFQKVFNKTFLDCLNHYRGSAFIEVFNGMKLFKDIKEEYKDDKEYLDIITYHLNNYEIIINKKRARKSKKRKANAIKNEDINLEKNKSKIIKNNSI